MLQNHPSCSNCELRSPFSLLSKSFVDANMAQPWVYKGNLVSNRIISCTFTSTYRGAFMKYWPMIPNPAALVCPETLVRLPVTFPVTVLTMSEEYSGKRGILRQSWSRHVTESPKLFKLWSEKSFLSLVHEFFGWRSPAALVYGRRSQKMLVILPVTFPLTGLMLSEEYSGKRVIFRQSWSRHVRESPKLFKCEVRSPFSLLSKSFVDASNMAQPCTNYKCI